MAGVRVVLSPTWRADLSAAEETLLNKRFGPDILADMQAGTPVLSRRLRDAEKFEVIPGNPPELHVGVYPDDEGILPYKLAVEYGFHGEEEVREYVTHTGHVVHAHTRMGNSPEQPYLRPALYRVRSA